MINWQVVTLIKSELAAVNVKALTFKIAGWQKHAAGQHYDLRLAAPGGYVAERSYSVASSPEMVRQLEFGVQLLEGGEVSPYLWQLKIGQPIELRGPIGGHFVWDVTMPGPLVLIGGGSGMVPLMAMLRHHQKQLTTSHGREVIFLISARTIDHVLYRDELAKIEQLDSGFKKIITLTDKQPSDWSSYSKRIDETMLKETLGHLIGQMPMIYVCGPTPFVEAVARQLIKLGFNSHEIKTERFGG